MNSKCNFCQYNKIIKVMYYDILFDKCDECNYLMCDISSFKILELAILKYFNIGNIKKYYNFNDLPFINKLLCKYFLILIKIKKIKLLDDILCNVCKKKLILCSNNILFCEYCNNVYFLKNQFSDLIIKKVKFIKKIEKILKKIKILK